MAPGDLPGLLAFLSGRPRWHRDAACRGMGAHHFILERAKGFDLPAATEAAQAVCAGCPVRTECAAAADAYDGTVGVWGGLTGRDRRTRRQAGAA